MGRVRLHACFERYLFYFGNLHLLRQTILTICELIVHFLDEVLKLIDFLLVFDQGFLCAIAVLVQKVYCGK
jgi:hypothetical protein